MCTVLFVELTQCITLRLVENNGRVMRQLQVDGALFSELAIQFCGIGELVVLLEQSLLPDLFGFQRNRTGLFDWN